MTQVVSDYRPSALTYRRRYSQIKRKVMVKRALAKAAEPKLMSDVLLKAAIVAFIPVAVVLGLHNWHSFTALLQQLQCYPWFNPFFILANSLMIMSVAIFIWRLLLIAKYRSVEGLEDARLPDCTIVVPAYNEGSCVLETLRSLVNCDYPAEKLQIIAIDDGSVDDTWMWMQRAEKEMPGRIEIIRHAKNGGKREALHTGFVRSRGSVLVTVDSDSMVEPATIRRLVSPFVLDSKIGAVAGNVRVWNTHEGIIPRMLDVTFNYSFDFIRSTQSVVNTVLCTPGALSAYRKDIVMPVLDEWMAQTFFGRPANIGEDRAITNLILREGYHVTFQRNAMVLTKVPTAYKGLCKMFIRWARSNVRESIVMCKFAFSKFRDTPATGGRINLVESIIQMTLVNFLLIYAIGCLVWHPVIFGTQMLAGMVIGGTSTAIVFALTRRTSEALLSYLYSMFYLVMLAWITPYSVLTAQKSGWLTRDIVVPADQAQPAASSQGSYVGDTVENSAA